MSVEIPTEQYAQVIEQIGGRKSLPNQSLTHRQTSRLTDVLPAPIYKKVPVRQPGPDEVLVNVKFSGVCHTDLHAMNGDWPLPVKMPLIGGHEGAGIVVARGELVQDVQIGDHVGIKWLNGSCMHCSYCMTSDEPLCADAQLSGYTVDGSFQQYAVAKAVQVARLSKDVSLEAVAPVLCAGITVYKGIKESGVRPGQWIAIAGAGGGLGNMALQYCRAMGIHTIAIDGGDEKREATAALGASAYVDFFTSKDIIADVKAATPDGLGPHAAILLAAAEKPFQQAAAYVRSRGVMVCIGLPAGARISTEVFDTVVRMIQIKGSYVGNRADTQEALDFFNRGLIKAPFKTVGLSELASVFEQMKANQIVGRIVVDTSR